ncbi:30S ribosomal protein S19 [Candidatus Anstonella stagnisolia]|nr:30S ribosomal protein S19 [Candidatus Anstonella stagnisolia]
MRGKDKAALEGITHEQMLALLTSRARRSVLRGASKSMVYKKFMKKVAAIKKANPAKVIKTHVRDAVVLPDWVGLTFGVHNGKEFKNVQITVDKIGCRLGDFAHTTGRVLHSGPGVGATRGSKFIPLK